LSTVGGEDLTNWNSRSSLEVLGTEGVLNGRGSIETHGGRWLEVHSTLSNGLGVGLEHNILDAKNSSGLGSLLLESELDSISSLDNTLSSGLRLGNSTSTISLITSEALTIIHIIDFGSSGGPNSSLTDDITLGADDLRVGNSGGGGGWESKSVSLGRVLGEGTGPSVSTASTGDGTSWERGNVEISGSRLPDDMLLTSEVYG
jgi:hypothetical protein